MDSQRAWAIIAANLDELVGRMLVVQKGTSIDVFCDSTGTHLSFSNPSGAANIKLCSVTCPDLEGHYGVRPRGNGFVNDEGEEIQKEKIAGYLVQYIIGAKDGGAEWGWEFRVSVDG